MKKRTKFLIVILTIAFGSAMIYIYSNRKGKTYVLRDYNPTTRIVSISEYVIRNKDTVFHGSFIKYNEKGIKIAEGNYVNGHIQGKCIFYYDNGKIESIEYRKKGEIKEECFWYYLNGTIEKYALYNPVGECIFIIDYDYDGVVGAYKGDPQIEIYQYKFAHKKRFNIINEQSLKVGDTLKHVYILANIPNTKRSFKVQNLDISNTKIERTITKKLPVEINVEEVLVKKGINRIRAIVEYKFNDQITPTLNDTISFEVKVN